MATEVQALTGGTVELAFVDQGHTGEERAAEQGIALEMIKLQEAKKGFVLLLRRWFVERRIAWRTRFRRFVRDFERLSETVAGLHFLAFACLMLSIATQLFASS